MVRASEGGEFSSKEAAKADGRLPLIFTYFLIDKELHLTYYMTSGRFL